MNNINFTAKNSFPLSTEVMGFLQDMVKLNANFTALGGTNYILVGCVDDGNGNISAGSIVINGEILPFEAGKKKTKITIEQKPKTLTAFGADYPEALISRTAKFSDTGEYEWDKLQRIESILQLAQRLNEFATIPKGLIAMFSGNVNNIPTGWALCDGLNGTPNLSGRFIVGFNQQDEDYDEIGKKGGEKLITLNISQIPKHSHEVKQYAGVTGNIDNSHITSAVTTASGNRTGEEGGGQSHENRPPYFVLAYIIKL